MTALLSTTDEESVDQLPDYTDLPSTKPLPRKAISDQVGITRRSA
jgi:hypothetical protein